MKCGAEEIVGGWKLQKKTNNPPHPMTAPDPLVTLTPKMPVFLKFEVLLVTSGPFWGGRGVQPEGSTPAAPPPPQALENSGAEGTHCFPFISLLWGVVWIMYTCTQCGSSPSVRLLFDEGGGRENLFQFDIGQMLQRDFLPKQNGATPFLRHVRAPWRNAVVWESLAWGCPVCWPRWCSCQH